jgi:hypothetical protein
VNRRGFLASAGIAVALPAGFVRSARAASEAELAYANFAIAAEFLMQDFYARALAAKLFAGTAKNGAMHARFNEGEHVKALSTLLTDAGQSVPVADDFAFQWPKETFSSAGTAAKAGIEIEGAAVGAYVSAATAITIPSYRSLFARMLADEGQHLAMLSWLVRGRPVGLSFPSALDLEAASQALEPYLG